MGAEHRPATWTRRRCRRHGRQGRRRLRRRRRTVSRALYRRRLWIGQHAHPRRRGGVVLRRLIRRGRRSGRAQGGFAPRCRAQARGRRRRSTEEAEGRRRRRGEHDDGSFACSHFQGARTRCSATGPRDASLAHRRCASRASCLLREG
jgi:hypothetical protein